MVSERTAGHKPGQPGRLDLRQALYNDQPTGTAPEIQLPLGQITRVHAFGVDIDPDKLQPDNSWFPPADEAGVFHQGIRPVLDRHPILRHSTVRTTGNGLHLLVHFRTPIELRTEGDQHRWDALIRLVQWSVPSDPAARGLKLLTRPPGATNSKNGCTVFDLAPGTPIEPEAVLAYAEATKLQPFRQLASLLLGEDQRVSPCPFCQHESSHLAIQERTGTCYRCGTVRLADLFGLVSRRDPIESGPARPDRAGKRQGGRRA